MYFTENGNLLTFLKLGDQLREGVQELLKKLRPATATLLSGDNEQAVAAVAEACGFDFCVAGYSPLQKRGYIDGLRKKGEIICMLGGGISDAPALTGANIGLSVATATDMSIQVSDILLKTDRLQVIPKIRALATLGIRLFSRTYFGRFFIMSPGGIGSVWNGDANSSDSRDDEQWLCCAL